MMSRWGVMFGLLLRRVDLGVEEGWFVWWKWQRMVWEYVNGKRRRSQLVGGESFYLSLWYN